MRASNLWQRRASVASSRNANALVVLTDGSCFVARLVARFEGDAERLCLYLCVSATVSTGRGVICRSGGEVALRGVGVRAGDVVRG